MAAKKRARKSKGKQHPVHAESLEHIARDIHRASTDVCLKELNPVQLFVVLSNIFDRESKRIQGILR